MLESAADALTMTDTPPSVRDLPAPRRVAIATLFREILATERELAELYGGFAPHTPLVHLRTALEDMAGAKRTRVAALTGLRPVLAEAAADAGAVPPPRPTLEVPVERRSDVFVRAFHGERQLEAAYRELLALLGGPALWPELAGLATGSARHRSLLRNLYLWYS